MVILVSNPIILLNSTRCPEHLNRSVFEIFRVSHVLPEIGNSVLIAQKNKKNCREK